MSADEKAKLEELAVKLIEYYHSNEVRKILVLRFPMTRRLYFFQQDEHRVKTARRPVVTSCTIEPYVEPKWGGYTPPPTHQIRLALKWEVKKGDASNGKDVACYPCARDASGEFKLCSVSQLDKKQRAKGLPEPVEPPPPEEIDLAVTHQEIMQGFLEEIRRLRGLGSGPIAVGFARLEYKFNWPNNQSGLDLRFYAEAFDDRTWPKLETKLRGTVRSQRLAEGFINHRLGSARLRTLAGETVDLHQEEFERDYPRWVGARIFREEARAAICPAVADALDQAEKEGLIAWQGRKVCLITMDEDYIKPDGKYQLKPAAMFHGIELLQLDRPTMRFSDPMSWAPANPPKIVHSAGVTRAAKPIPKTKAIAAFKELVTPWLAEPPTTQAIVEAFAQFFRDVGVKDADDNVRFEWGANHRLELKAFTDLRKKKGTSSAEKYQWIGITREIQAGGEDDDPALCVLLYFAPATGDEPAQNIEFSGLDQLDESLRDLAKNPFVAKLWNRKPAKVVGFVAAVG